MKISICDYNVGNISSVVTMCRHFGFMPIVTQDVAVMDSSDLVILPGQGAYATAMEGLKASGCADFIKSYVLDRRPFLGICVGFQLLFEGSEEMEFTPGLGLFPGVFKLFPSSDLKVPHMGWNSLSVTDHQENYLSFQDQYVYFVHSYYLADTDPSIMCMQTQYGLPFVSSIATSSLFATQFHPEKSGDVGISMLKTFFDQVK